MQLGSPPIAAPPGTGPLMSWIAAAVPFIVAGGAIAAMLISILFRYSGRFREFWARNVCDWMEQHVPKVKE
jgi:hypothetical protein